VKWLKQECAMMVRAEKNGRTVLPLNWKTLECRKCGLTSPIRLTDGLYSPFAGMLGVDLSRGLRPISFHCSQGFRDRAIAHPNHAAPRIVHVDGHPQRCGNNGSVNGVE
jgi:hypothetical protein